MRNHPAFIPLWLAYFTSHNVFRVELRNFKNPLHQVLQPGESPALLRDPNWPALDDHAGAHPGLSLWTTPPREPCHGSGSPLSVCTLPDLAKAPRHPDYFSTF